MPTYEYKCNNCEHDFEVFQKMSDEPVKICPKCGKDLRRLIFGGAGVIFKGSGFYVTDKNKSAAAPAKTAECKAGREDNAGQKDKAGTEDKTKSIDAKPAAASCCDSCPAAASCEKT